MFGHFTTLCMNGLKTKRLSSNFAYDIKQKGSLLDIGGTFSEKSAFYLLAPSKQMSFLAISKEHIFSKTQGTRLGATVAPNKDKFKRIY